MQLYFNVDYVYIEASSTSPYQVCKIEELIKVSAGASILITSTHSLLALPLEYKWQCRG